MTPLTRRHQPSKRQQGSILIGLIVAIAAFSVLGLIMYSLSSTSDFSQIQGQAATRAVYLAQSGYRYFASSYKGAGTDAKDKNLFLASIHNQTYTLAGSDGKFLIRIKPYYFMSLGDSTLNSGGSFTAIFPGEGPFTVPAAGTLAVYQTGGYKYIDYGNQSASGENITFGNLSGGDLPVDVKTGDSLTPVVFPSSNQSVSKNGTLSIIDAGGIFPNRFGFFEISTDPQNVYYYEQRSGNSITNILLLKDPNLDFIFSATTADAVIVHTFANVSVTGTYGAGGPLEASHTFSRLCSLGFTAGGNSAQPGGNQFTDQGDVVNFATNWSVDAGVAGVVSGGQTEHDPAIQLKGTTVELHLNWEGNANIPDLLEAWKSEGDLLSYGLQAKIKIDDTGSKGRHYLIGLSFRKDNNFENSYGISFFRSYKNDKASKKPDWIKSTAFSDIAALADIGGTIFVVFWKKITGTYTVIDSKPLSPSDNVLDGSAELQDWSTLMVKINEQFSGPSGSRENHISGFIQGPTQYPRKMISWDEALFLPVAWTGHVQPIVDSSLTSINFDTRKPVEIGLHGFYDSSAANNQLIDDFSMKVVGVTGGGSGISGIPGF